MAQTGYKQFCPVAMAAEILCTRWTVVMLREMMAGSTRFNELRRGVARMSPALLSQRLKELEQAGIVSRDPIRGETDAYEYHLTQAGHDLKPVIEGFGMWGQRWIHSQLSLQNLDAQLLMWDVRRNLDTTPMPERRSTIRFRYPDAPACHRTWWLVVTPGADVDLCSIDPGYDVDLFVGSDLRTMTAIWMGWDTVVKAVGDGRMELIGDRDLARHIQTWLGLSPFAKGRRMVA